MGRGTEGVVQGEQSHLLSYACVLSDRPKDQTGQINCKCKLLIIRRKKASAALLKEKLLSLQKERSSPGSQRSQENGILKSQPLRTCLLGTEK